MKMRSYWRAGWPYRKTGSLDIDTRVNAEAEIGVTRLQAKDRQRRPAKQRRESAKGPGASSPSRTSAGSGPADTPSLDPWPPGPEDGNLLRGSRPAGRAEHRVLRTVSRRHVSQCVPLVLRLVLRVRGAVAFGCLPSAGLMGSNPEFWFLLISAETDCLHVWHVPLLREKTPAHSPLSVLNTKLSLGRASFIINEVPLLYPFAVVNNLSQY